MAITPIVALPDVKTFLNIADTESDTKLTQFISVASQMITHRIGQVAGSPSIDEWYDGGTERIVLRNGGPIQSVTSVTEVIGPAVYSLTQVTLDSAPGINAFTFSVDLTAGLLVRRAAGSAVPFAPGVRNIHIVYVAGYGTVPDDIQHACLLLIKHLWETQRGTGRKGTGGGEQPVAPTVVPPRVLEILSQYQVPGIA